MSYRLKKNPNLLVLDLKEYEMALDFARNNDLQAEFPDIQKLGILHHSGNALERTGYVYTDYLESIGSSLPYVSSVVLRGCGMVNDKKAKALALAVARDREPGLGDGELKERLRDGRMRFFKSSDTDQRNPKTIRQFTLDTVKKGGVSALEKGTKPIVEALEKSSIGKALPDGQRPSIECYIAGYNADPAQGAIAHRGIKNAEDRFGSAPKAIRFSI